MSGLENPSPTDHSPQKGHRLIGWIGAASTLVAVAAWVALVLHYEYQVAWLGDYVVAEDVLFLAGIAGIVLTRSVQRWGPSRGVRDATTRVLDRRHRRLAGCRGIRRAVHSPTGPVRTRSRPSP